MLYDITTTTIFFFTQPETSTQERGRSHLSRYMDLSRKIKDSRNIRQAKQLVSLSFVNNVFTLIIFNSFAFETLAKLSNSRADYHSAIEYFQKARQFAIASGDMSLANREKCEEGVGRTNLEILNVLDSLSSRSDAAIPFEEELGKDVKNSFLNALTDIYAP